jgi:hypothetical protein
LTCIQDVPSLNLSWETSYPDWSFFVDQTSSKPSHQHFWFSACLISDDHAFYQMNTVVDGSLSFQRSLQSKLHSLFILLPGKHLDCVLLLVILWCCVYIVFWIFMTVLRHFPHPPTYLIIWILHSTLSILNKCYIHNAFGGNCTSIFKWLVVIGLTDDFIIFYFLGIRPRILWILGLCIDH